MLRKDDLVQTIDSILGSNLGHDFERSEVRVGEDNDGDPSLFVKAFLKEGSPMPSTRTMIEVKTLLRLQLEERGEDRFPYLAFGHLPDATRPPSMQR